MDNAPARGDWPHVLPDRRTHLELQELNLRFLELVGLLASSAPAPKEPGAAHHAVLGLEGPLAQRIARLRPGRRVELSRCPYALHGVGLQDHAFWEAARGDAATAAAPARPAGMLPAPHLPPAQLAEVRDFLFLSLAWGWHLATTNPIAARWMLGARADELARLRALPFSALRRIANTNPALLQARLSDQRRFWEDLVASVEAGSRQARFAAVSLGLQLSAAAGASRFAADAVAAPRGPAPPAAG